MIIVVHQIVVDNVKLLLKTKVEFYIDNIYSNKR